MNKHRIIALALALLICVTVMPFNTALAASKVKIADFGDKGLYPYIMVAKACGVRWDMLAAIDLYEGRDIAHPDESRLWTLASQLAARSGQSERNQLKAYTESSSKRTKIQDQITRLSNIANIAKGKRFPLDWNTGYVYEDNWATPRGNAQERSHEGIDIMAAYGTEVKSVCAGTVEKYGWNTLGGWRIGIRGNDGVYYYYAHLSSYASGIKAGKSVKAGQIIGYVGDTGYGPEGTSGQMLPHLHFGMYEAPGLTPVNPYPFLKLW